MPEPKAINTLAVAWQYRMADNYAAGALISKTGPMSSMPEPKAILAILFFTRPKPLSQGERVYFCLSRSNLRHFDFEASAAGEPKEGRL